MQKGAIILGATSGIGLQVALLLLEQGWRVGIAGRRRDKLQEILQRHPALQVTQIDATASDAPQRLEAFIQVMGGIDLYFHSAGIGFQNRALCPDTELRTVRTNAEGFVRMLTAAWHYFAAKGGGHIAAISSIAGTKGLGAAPAYSATKALNQTYIQALAQLSRMQATNIYFTDIRPGFVDTALLSDGRSYPLMMKPQRVAADIVRAIVRRRRVATIDWRYRLLVLGWRLIPNWLWERLHIAN